MAQWQGGQDTAWRHVGRVFEAAGKTVTRYVDCYRAGRAAVAETVSLDAAPLAIGGGEFTGLDDEVRWTPRALRPRISSAPAARRWRA